jgi:hypothetical protein
MKPDAYGYKMKNNHYPPWDEDANYRRYIDAFIKSIALDHPVPRYAVTGRKVTTPEEAASNIAGSVVKVVDLQTKEVMAERISYRYSAPASTEQLTCPLEFEGTGFVQKVLKPAPIQQNEPPAINQQEQSIKGSNKGVSVSE